MIISLPRTVRRLYFMTMLVAVSCVLYYVLSWVSAWISPTRNVEIPEGTAVRAFQDVQYGEQGQSAAERLRLFTGTGSNGTDAGLREKYVESIYSMSWNNAVPAAGPKPAAKPHEAA